MNSPLEIREVRLRDTFVDCTAASNAMARGAAAGQSTACPDCDPQSA
jgi:hypothetical protein